MSGEDKDNERITAQSAPNDVTCWRDYNQAANIKAGAAKLGREYLTSASLKTEDVIYGEGRKVVYYGHVHTYARMLYTHKLYS